MTDDLPFVTFKLAKTWVKLSKALEDHVDVEESPVLSHFNTLLRDPRLSTVGTVEINAVFEDLSLKAFQDRVEQVHDARFEDEFPIMPHIGDY